MTSTQQNQSIRVLRDLEPQKVFYYFEEITRIPHGSENEKQLSDYIVCLAKERGYQVTQDSSWNVSIEIPATPGYESRKKIMLQGHIDMVCQKEEGAIFDFKKQPLDIYIENGFIRAKGTTLGADDGFGVAMMLAIMDSPELEHAPLQLIFTTAEEIFLVGARAMADEMLTGRYLIGLDCAFDDGIIVSCAGVSIARSILKTNRSPYDIANTKVFDISVGGLTGGHSGNTIHFARANAIKILGEILSFLHKQVAFRIVKLEGGTVINAIPYQAKAQIVCDITDAKQIEKICQELAQKIKRAYARTDGNMQITCNSSNQITCSTAYSEEQTSKAIQLLNLLENGARSIIDDAFTSAECSCNVAVLEGTDDELHIRIAIRSNSEYHHDALINKYEMLSNLVGATYKLQQRLYAWEYQPNSLLQEQAAKLYEEINGKAPIIKKVHATVEAVEFVGKMKRRGLPIDIINIGCNNLEPHTPKERLEIASVGRTYKLLTRLIASLD